MPYLESMTYEDFTSSNVCQLLIIGSTESISDRLLSQDVFDHFAFYVREAEVAATVAVG